MPYTIWVISSSYILLFLVIFHCFYLEKYGLGNCWGFRLNHGLVKITSNFLYGFLVSCLYHKGDFKLIYLIIFCVFQCFYIMTLFWNMAWEKLRFLIKSIFYEVLTRVFKFDTWIHCIIFIDTLLITCWYISLFSAFWVFSIFSLKKIALGI